MFQRWKISWIKFFRNSQCEKFALVMFSPWSMNCTLFRCRLCGKIFLFTIDTVHSHLKRSHKISWDTYKQKYLCSDRDGLLMDLPLQVFFYSKRFLMTIFFATGNRVLRTRIRNSMIRNRLQRYKIFDFFVRSGSLKKEIYSLRFTWWCSLMISGTFNADRRSRSGSGSQKGEKYTKFKKLI